MSRRRCGRLLFDENENIEQQWHGRRVSVPFSDCGDTNNSSYILDNSNGLLYHI